MRMSRLFGHTLRQAPSEARMASHKLLLRAGMIRPSAEGMYTYLTLGRRVLRQIERIVRREMEAIGGQELLMPFTLTTEEVAADLFHKEIESYRQLPTLIYQIRPKLRDEYRARGGLMETQEFVSQEALSFHADSEGLNDFYPRLYQAYANIFQTCRLETVAVETEDGNEFIVPYQSSERKFLLCSKGDYAAHAERAEFTKPEAAQEAERAIEKVATPDCKTIQALANYVGAPIEKTLKAMLYATEEGEVIFAVIRGDLGISETKLKTALGGADLYTAIEREIVAVGAVPGYASPIGVRGAKVVVDDSALLGSNFVAGANEHGYHLMNVNYPRDFQADILTDIAQAQAGYTCPRCHGQLTEMPGIEIGSLKRGQSIGTTYLDRGGKAKPIVMGSYGLDLGRLMADVVEQHHDQSGIIWPAPIAPYHIHLVVLGTGEEIVTKAEDVYDNLRTLGYKVLYDDRDGSAGVKFNDADLIGIPTRLTLSRRTLKENAIEIKLRWEERRETIGLDTLPSKLKRLL
ncbi:MAG: proline--tRNA ligase [Anaerolineales bacterium]|nr:proline--tRNA ligase [Anaerolineales bacterium]